MGSVLFDMLQCLLTFQFYWSTPSPERTTEVPLTIRQFGVYALFRLAVRTKHHWRIESTAPFASLLFSIAYNRFWDVASLRTAMRTSVHADSTIIATRFKLFFGRRHSVFAHFQQTRRQTMANSTENQPRHVQDALVTLRRIVKRLGNYQEGAILSDASKALQRGNYRYAIENIKLCSGYPNLNQGEARQLDIIISLLQEDRYFWFSPFVMKLIYWLSLIPLSDKIELIVWLCHRIPDTPLVYLPHFHQSKMSIKTCTLDDLARRLSFETPEALKQYSKHANREYGFYKVWKDEQDHSKGSRIINPPSEELKTIQRKLLDTTLYSLFTPDNMGGGKQSSVFSIMKRHMHKDLLIRFDISKFFPSVKSRHVYRMLRSRGASRDVAEVITNLTTYRGHLPQGAPCSTHLAKLVVLTPAKHLINYLKRFGQKIDVSFWVDDIVISGPMSLAKLTKSHVVDDIFFRYGFELNNKKTTIMDKSSEQEALGIRVDHHRMRPASSILLRYSQIIQQHGYNSQNANGMRRFIKSVTIN